MALPPPIELFEAARFKVGDRVHTLPDTTPGIDPRQVSLLKFFPFHALIFCRSYITFSPHLYDWPCGLRGYAVREQRGLAKPEVSVPPT